MRPCELPASGWPVELVDDVGGEQREAHLVAAGAQRAARVFLGAGGDPRPRRTEVELVVADRRRVVAERAVRREHRRALVEVGLQRALEEIAAVEEQHAAAVARARRAHVGDVAAEQRHPTLPAGVGGDVAVQIVGADDGDGDGARTTLRRGGVRRGGAAGEDRRREER